MSNSLSTLIDQVRTSAAARTPLFIRAGGSKDFYGNERTGERLDPRAHCGIVSYEPSELVITARCGTPLAELEAALSEHGQMLAFEPPHFGAGATVGGMVAVGLSGPRRAAVPMGGAVRDFVLGAQLLNARGEVLRFGGQVMKNVAGFDVARLLVGSLGTLGLIVEASLKVLPRPAHEQTLQLALPEAQAIGQINRWAQQPWPISATAWHQGTLHVRLSGSRAAVAAAQQAIGGEPIEAQALWTEVREQTHPFFAFKSEDDTPLWRLSVPSTTPPLDLGPTFIEWGGALRWVRSRLPAAMLRERAATAGGHATLFRGGERSASVFHPLDPVLTQLHQRIKTEFDPHGLFGPLL